VSVTTTVTTTVPAKPLITGGLTAAAVAAAGEFAGISLVVGGAPIPAFGFAVLTVIFSVVGGLLPSHATTVVRPGNGTTTMTDGPFAETKEQLGGFWVIQCDDLDQALSWAEKCALACGCPIEVRPFNDGSGE
jgi:hypothetical protein